MGKPEHQSIIELNGQRFNAQTGKLIDSVSAPIQAARPTTMNDIAPMRQVERSTTPSKQMHKTAQSSKTLMRHAVKKPSTITDHKTIAMDVVPHFPGQATLDKFHTFSPERGQRAETIKQNALVNRFGGELREAPTSVKTQPVVQPQSFAPHMPVSIPILPPSANRTATNKILDKGLRNATSHEAVTAKKPNLGHRVGHKLGLSARAAKVTVGALGVLVLGGFLIYQNIPSISVRYASTKAGVHASLPTYQPAGFTINSHVAYSPGEISVAYKANADNRTYTVTQKSTAWNSDALKEHLMGETGVIPQSYPDNGRTIYLHGTNQADWVNNGVWYSISGNSNLNTDQLIKIATSL